MRTVTGRCRRERGGGSEAEHDKHNCAIVSHTRDNSLNTNLKRKFKIETILIYEKKTVHRPEALLVAAAGRLPRRSFVGVLVVCWSSLSQYPLACYPDAG